MTERSIESYQEEALLHLRDMNLEGKITKEEWNAFELEFAQLKGNPELVDVALIQKMAA